MRPGRLPTVGRAAGEPLLSCLAAYGSEAGAAGHPGVSPVATSSSKGLIRDRVLGLRLGVVHSTGPVVPNRRVVLAKPFVPPEFSSLGCTRSPCPVPGFLLSPSPVLLEDRGGWKDGGCLAVLVPELC